MDQNPFNFNKKYDRVMPRVCNRSRSSLKSSSFVTRHNTPSSVRLSGKPPALNVSQSFSELPTILNNYNPDCERPMKRTFVVKPRKTLKSLDPALSPAKPVTSFRDPSKKSRNLRVGASERSVLTSNREKWSESHMNQCYSSQSHSRLKELKEEIKVYNEREKLMKLRCNLYQNCGVVLDDIGWPATDKAIQVECSDREKQKDDEIVNMKR